MRQITKATQFATGHGTHKYLVEYEGEWSDEDMITAVDNGVFDNPSAKDLEMHHYGGSVMWHKNENSAIVHVYYD